MNKVIVVYPTKTKHYPSRHVTVYTGTMEQCMWFFNYVFDGIYEIPAGYIVIE